MPRLKEFDCSVCRSKHPRPVGRNCTRNTAVATALSTSEPADISVTSNRSSSTLSDDVAQQLLAGLNTVTARLDSIDRRVQKTKEAVATKQDVALPGPSSSSPLASHTRSFRHTLANPGADLNPPRDSVVPSLDYVRSNEAINAQATSRVTELQSMNSAPSQGKLISQRGGPNEVRIKRHVDWPQHFILVGPKKERPSYDSLTMPQWVAGVLRSIQYESNPQFRESMLDYVAGLMEDASDFSFDSSRACYAYVLAHMEQDRFDWNNQAELERNRRTHSQRHTAPVNPQSEPVVTKGKKRNSFKTVPCKYFHNGHCKVSPYSHMTNGTFYTHVCAKCNGPHPTKSCGEKKVKNV